MPLYSTTPADHPAIVDLVNSVYRGDSARQGWTHEADYLGGQRIDLANLRADLAAQPQARLLAFRDAPDTETLGCVWLEPAGDASWYLGMLTVRPEQQDRKLGRTILDEAEALARANGVHSMRMTVVGIRDTLIEWYLRRGYRLTDERRPFPYGDGRFGTPMRADLEFLVLEKALGVS